MIHQVMQQENLPSSPRRNPLQILIHPSVRPEMILVSALLFSWGMFEIIKTADHVMQAFMTKAYLRDGWSALFHSSRGLMITTVFFGMSLSQVICAIGIIRAKQWAHWATQLLLGMIIAYKSFVLITQTVEMPVKLSTSTSTNEVEFPFTIILLALTDLFKYFALFYFASGRHSRLSS